MTRYGLATLLGLFVCLFQILAVPSVAWAQDNTRLPSLMVAEAQFERGEWQDAIRTGELLNSADGLALAARAALADAAYKLDEDVRLAAIVRALDLASRALAQEPAHPEALLQSAAAYGFRALVTRSSDDARRARGLIDRALMIAPANPYILAGLGSWHAQTVLEAGGFMGRLMFGAKRSSMMMAYDAAIAIAPDNLAIRAGYGLLLLRFKKKGYKDRGLAHLRHAATMTPKGAFERRLLLQAQQVLAADRAGADARDLRAMADAMTPFAGRTYP